MDDVIMTNVREFVRQRVTELGLNLQQVSIALGKNQTYIQQFLTKGTPRKLDEDTRKALAAILNCSEDALSEPRLANENMAGVSVVLRHPIPGASGPVSGPAKDRTLPIFGRAQGGNYGMVLVPTDDRPVDWTYRPGQLEGVPDAYATYVYGDSMSPAFEEGDLALIHPHAAVTTGSDVHIILNSDEAFVKRLVSRSRTVITVQQFNPAETFTIDAAKIRYLRKVVGKWSR